MNVEPRMPATVGWKSKAGAYPLQTGCSTCTSSPRAAFDERMTRSTTSCGEACFASAHEEVSRLGHVVQRPLLLPGLLHIDRDPQGTQALRPLQIFQLNVLHT